MTWLNLMEYFPKIGPASSLSSLLFQCPKPWLSEARGVSCSAVFSSVNTCILCASPSLQCPSESQTVSEMVASFSHRALAGESCLEDCGRTQKFCSFSCSFPLLKLAIFTYWQTRCLQALCWRV